MARILVVDDDNDVLKLVEGVFAFAGHTVFTSDDPFKAIDLLDNSEFDLLISDANMPHFSGFELVQTIRKNPRFAKLAVAMLTGLRERKDIERALKVGVDDYIVKPIDPMILMQKVTALFERKPPEKRPEAYFNELDPMAKAYIKTPFRIERISELGALVVSTVPLVPGQVLDIKGAFFDSLSAEVPPMKVLSLEPKKKEGEWRAQLIFLGAREAFLQKIRRWIFSHGSSNRRPVSGA